MCSALVLTLLVYTLSSPDAYVSGEALTTLTVWVVVGIANIAVCVYIGCVIQPQVNDLSSVCRVGGVH